MGSGRTDAALGGGDIAVMYDDDSDDDAADDDGEDDCAYCGAPLFGSMT